MAPTLNWGLIGTPKDEPFASSAVKLQSVDINVSVRGFVAKVKSCLTYHNSTNNALEVEYRIPIDEGAAVYKFEALVNDRKITAHCMEKKKAEGVYKDAVKKGHTAVLAREDSLTCDTLHLALGNLPQGTKAVLQLSMVMELKVQTDGAVNFALPTVLNPRYCPADITPDQHTASVSRYGSPDAIVVSEAYTFGIQAAVQGGHTISRIISHSDALNVKLSDDAMSAEISQDGGFTCNHDWSMLVYYTNPYKTHIIRETGDRSGTGIMKDDLIMINLHPEIPQESYSNMNEVIIVVDRSGSMEGEKMQSARATLLLFLKSLPLGCYFNVISFGSHHTLLFPEGSRAYTETALRDACAEQERMDADMGGTEILQPLKQIYSQPPKPGYARQILLLSDGEVFNVDQVKQLVSRHSLETRVFSVGIGHGASTALIKGIARAGRGRSEMVLQQDKLQLKVMGLVKSMLQETVQEVAVNFEVDPPSGIKLVPKVPPVIFGGQHLTLYTRVPIASTVKSISIRGVVGKNVLDAGVQGSSIVTVHDEDMTLHRLAARSQINQWQLDDEEDVAEDMIALSTASGVVSRRTALVGVDQDMQPVATAPPPSFKKRCSAYAPSQKRCSAYAPQAVFGSMMKGLSNVLQPQAAFGDMRQRSADEPQAVFGSMMGGGLFGARRKCKISSSSIGYEKRGFAGESLSVDLPAVKSNEESAVSLIQVVILQRFDGSWTLKDVANLALLPLDQLHDANIAKNEIAWATALVLVLLEKRFSSQKDQWVLMANKARNFISNCGEDVEALIKSAQSIITI